MAAVDAEVILLSRYWSLEDGPPGRDLGFVGLALVEGPGELSSSPLSSHSSSVCKSQKYTLLFSFPITNIGRWNGDVNRENLM